MASNASFHATIVVLTLLLSLFIFPKVTSSITCTKFMINLSSCIAYAAGITQSPHPECCEALDRWLATIKTEKERRRGCLCFKEILYMRNIDGDKWASIPKQCNISLGYPISKSTHCSK
ncbi:Non-specific lipid-transfer protein 3 [Dendrobium catenatum]|uniref:Non-specific lipid-transfer protein 3 n=1 Tax=Dendrobium catenatum TaxID=906689 RepID=A0A2I0WGS4_9ASPA|nr:Non-specific lipid-transfer protein 3 [Dendrobium catenatum]